jgi:hypothetical protein
MNPRIAAIYGVSGRIVEDEPGYDRGDSFRRRKVDSYEEIAIEGLRRVYLGATDRGSIMAFLE